MPIFIPETGNIFPTIAEAARSVGVDPSNAGKVLRGQRSSAGGYTFTSVAKAPTQREITKMAKAAASALSDAQRQRRQASRQRSQQRVQQRRQQSQPARRTAEQREQIKRAHDALIEANKMIRQSKRTGSGKMALKDLQSLVEQMGASKRGFFKTSKKGMMEYTDLEQLVQRIQTIIEQEAARREQYDVNYAQQYTLKSVQEAKAKHDALDALSRAYGKLREVKERSSGRFAYQDVYSNMIRDVQNLDADQIMDLANRLEEWLDSDRYKSQNELDDIYAKWEAEVEGADYDEGDDDEPTYISYN